MWCYVLVVYVDRMRGRGEGDNEGVKKGKKCDWKEVKNESKDIRTKEKGRNIKRDVIMNEGSNKLVSKKRGRKEGKEATVLRCDVTCPRHRRCSWCCCR
jgi:hypothetical protein